MVGSANLAQVLCDGVLTDELGALADVVALRVLKEHLLERVAVHSQIDTLRRRVLVLQTWKPQQAESAQASKNNASHASSLPSPIATCIKSPDFYFL